MLRKLFLNKTYCIGSLPSLWRIFGQVIRTNLRSYSDEKDKKTVPTTLGKYKPFREEQSPVILDVEEERRQHDLNISITEEEEEEEESPFIGISPETGVHGVLDIEELVSILRKENALDIFVAKVPPEYRYVQHIVVVSGKTVRHMSGMAEFVRRVYKYKTQEQGDTRFIPMIEGQKSTDWLAIDLGNIALHIFSRQKRELYDLESLWSVGGEHDRIANLKDDSMFGMLGNAFENYPGK